MQDHVLQVFGTPLVIAPYYFQTPPAELKPHSFADCKYTFPIITPLPTITPLLSHPLQMLQQQLKQAVISHPAVLTPLVVTPPQCPRPVLITRGIEDITPPQYRTRCNINFPKRPNGITGGVVSCVVYGR